MSKHAPIPIGEPHASQHDFKSGEEPVADEFGNADHDLAGFIPTLDFVDPGTDQRAVELEDQGPPPPVPPSDEAQMRNSGIRWNFSTKGD